MSATETEPEKVIVGGTDRGIDFSVLDELDFRPTFADKCESIRKNFDCPNEAELVCESKCCQGRILLCEDCYFWFLGECKNQAGRIFRCRWCKSAVILGPEHLRVVKRIKA